MKSLLPNSAIAVCFLVSALVGCGGGSDSARPNPGEAVFEGGRKINIVATTGQVGDAVRTVAGEHAEVTVMMGPGNDPHLYKELPSDIKKLDAADLTVFNGLHLEGTLADTFHRIGRRKPVFAMSQRLEAEKDSRLTFPADFAGLADPHVWHDAALWADCVAALADRLAKYDPPHAEDYQRNAEAYRAELLALDKEIREQIETIPEDRRLLVTAHDAFGYYSKTYGLESVGLKGVSTEDEVDLKHMQEVAQLVIDRKLPAVFVETSVADRIMEALIEPCRKAGHEVRIGNALYSDALGNPDSGADTYLGMMRANTKSIVEGLTSTGSP